MFSEPGIRWDSIGLRQIKKSNFFIYVTVLWEFPGLFEFSVITYGTLEKTHRHGFYGLLSQKRVSLNTPAAHWACLVLNPPQTTPPTVRLRYCPAPAPHPALLQFSSYTILLPNTSLHTHLFIILPFPWIESNLKAGSFVSYSLLYPQCQEQCLAHNS